MGKRERWISGNPGWEELLERQNMGILCSLVEEMMGNLCTRGTRDVHAVDFVVQISSCFIHLRFLFSIGNIIYKKNLIFFSKNKHLKLNIIEIKITFIVEFQAVAPFGQNHESELQSVPHGDCQEVCMLCRIALDIAS